MSGYLKIPIISGGGGGAVDSVNGDTGPAVVLDATDIGLGNVDNTSDANKPVSTATQTALDLKQDDIVANNNQIVYQNGSGVIEGLPGFYKESTYGGLQVSLDVAPTNSGGHTLNTNNLNIRPTINSPTESWTMNSVSLYVDPDSSGFTFGTGGQAVQMDNHYIQHLGTSNIGAVSFEQRSFDIGNGTDPISVNGIGYSFGFGSVHANVTVTNQIQGYGFQINTDVASTLTNGINAFYDFANINSSAGVPGYNCFIANPNIAAIKNNTNFNGITTGPTIPSFIGNAGFTGIGVFGDLGTFDTGSFNGVSVNPTIDLVNYAAGINVSMDNVTVTAAVQSSIVIQDLTITAAQGGADGNNATFEWTGGGTAGAEVVSGSFPTFAVQIESGVTTATQLKAALDVYGPLVALISTLISGAGANTQITQGPTNLAGGVNAGRKQAAYLDGDVEITGSLSFGGALSIGQLNAFATQALVDGGGNPSSVHLLISQPTVAANVVIANADMLGVNTAALIQIGDNATVTTAFIGVAALGLPAVLTMGAGSTVDRVSGATFALSLDGGAGGGTVDEVYLCRALAIPNGVTAVNKLYGYKYDLPFGDPGTTSWGFYSSVASSHNYLAGDLKIGGTDVVDAGYTFHNEGNTYLEGETKFSSNVGFYATTPVAQQPSSGVQTAGAVYTATEQVMIQEMYDALRAYGLLS